MPMPRIVDPSKYKKTKIDKEIERLEGKKEEKVEKKPEQSEKKKRSTFTIIYILVAIAVFGLGLLVICLMNLGLHGYFGL